MSSNRNNKSKQAASIKLANQAEVHHSEPLYFNREFSWLAFNRRVLGEANNPLNPLMERVKFLAISDANLEEFFNVRVAGLWGQVEAGVDKHSIDGLSAQEQIKEITKLSKKLLKAQQKTWQQLCLELARVGIEILTPEEISNVEKNWLNGFFEEQLFPALTPMAIDPAHPFPFIPNDGFVMLLKVKKNQKPKINWALLPIPKTLPRFIQLGRSQRFVMIEDVLPLYFDALFPGFKIDDMGLAHVIRDSELDIDEEVEDLVEMYKDALRRRKHGNVIRLVVNDAFPDDLLTNLVNELEVEEDAIFDVDGRLNLSDLHSLRQYQFPSTLSYARYNAPMPRQITDAHNNYFDAIKQGDILIHHPYENFEAIINFLRQAARDPNVLAIKQTLYRTTLDSPMTKALIDAAESGKSVTAVVELKARFDEETNINIADALERAGVHVVYGVIGLKTHAKMTLVVRREGKHIVNYVHFGTGNYHPITAKQYTDVSYLSCNKALCEDAIKTFNFVTGYGVPKELNYLSISPVNLQKKILTLIEQEIENAQKGLPAGIWAKMNALVDPTLIDALYKASNAGVKINLVVRGMCCLRPGVQGLSENIEVHSIVGRFLEHTRAICFANGHELPSLHARVFISSADWMPRNFYSRVETLVEIPDKKVQHQLLAVLMAANLKDKAQSWRLLPDGSYERLSEEKTFSAQQYFMGNPHLSDKILVADD